MFAYFSNIFALSLSILFYVFTVPDNCLKAHILFQENYDGEISAHTWISNWPRMKPTQGLDRDQDYTYLIAQLIECFT